MGRLFLILCATLFLTFPAAFAAPVAEEEASDDGGQLIPRSVIPDFFNKNKDAEPVPDVEADGPPPPIQRNFDSLPAPVAKTRTALMAAARSGSLNALNNFFERGDEPTQLSFGGEVGDPIAFLRESSGDDEGYEILAILLEVLEAGYVHQGADTPHEVYVWPYFSAYALEDLTPPQKIELYQILTAGDVQDSMEFGAYIFYRIGIAPDGRWTFFIAGD
jgi:hypothetical protein